jgi:hypothetical protein
MLLNQALILGFDADSTAFSVFDGAQIFSHTSDYDRASVG